MRAYLSCLESHDKGSSWRKDGRRGPSYSIQLSHAYDSLTQPCVGSSQLTIVAPFWSRSIQDTDCNDLYGRLLHMQRGVCRCHWPVYKARNVLTSCGCYGMRKAVSSADKPDTAWLPRQRGSQWQRSRYPYVHSRSPVAVHITHPRHAHHFSGLSVHNWLPY